MKDTKVYNYNLKGVRTVINYEGRDKESEGNELG